MKSSNPVLRTLTQESQAASGYAYGGVDAFSRAVPASERFTVAGAAGKTAVLLAVTMLSGGYTWAQFFAGRADAVMGGMMVGVIGGLIVALVTIFRPMLARYTAPLYAVLEGLALGGISAVMAQQYAGLPLLAVGLTMATLFGMLGLYRAGVLRATDRFRSVVVGATVAIAIFYLISMVVGFFGVQVPMIHETGMVGIGFSVFVTSIAALNLILDFDLIEQAAAAGVDKRLEWFGAFGLLVTLVWLYLEMLRLLSKLNRR